MTTDNKDNKQDQGQIKQQQPNQNPSGSVNPTDKSKNPGQEGMRDPKNVNDVTKKDPTRDNPSQRRDEEQQEPETGKRRAS
jgi:hypothetical protein